MEEIKELGIGEYVRTESGIIDKVIDIKEAGSGIRYGGESFEDTIVVLNGDLLSETRVALGDIVKHSKNIKDLIKIGDYVNGYSIDNIINGVLVHRANGIDRSGYLIPIAQYENDIKSIVTKEQFASLEYRI